MLCQHIVLEETNYGTPNARTVSARLMGHLFFFFLLSVDGRFLQGHFCLDGKGSLVTVTKLTASAGSVAATSFWRVWSGSRSRALSPCTNEGVAFFEHTRPVFQAP